MGNYDAPLYQSAVSTAYKTAGLLQVNIVTGTNRRIQVYEIEMGQTGGISSSDTQCQWDVSRFSATNALAGSAVVPNLLDPADVSPLSLFYNNITTELTYTGVNFGLSVKNWGINQRGSYRWRALDDGDNIVVAAVAATGVGVRVQSLSFNSSAVGNMAFIER